MSVARGVGYLSKQTAFVERHKLFFERFPNLMTAINIAFDRTITADGAADPIIFYLGIRAIDDFEAILVSAANDLALPAQALLRGMYERIVTMARLHDHPEDTTAFAEFDYVQRRKVAKAIESVYGIPPEKEADMADLEKEYQRVRANYEITCETCGTRPRPGWSKLDFVSMAKQQKRFADLLAPAYYVPLLQAHSTLASASAVLELKNGVPLYTHDRIQLSDEAFRLAYVLALHTLGMIYDHFGFAELSQPLDVALKDHFEIYREADEKSPEASGA